jgi:predicted nucleotidyltransferase component of viral defense system
MELPALENFSLVGGTALSLIYGHRKSVDIDLFCNKEFDNAETVAALQKKYGDGFVVEQKPIHFGIFAFIDTIKTDLVRHPHPLIRPINVIDGIRMFSTEDIIAMKVQAILGRGKKKDFWDIAALLKQFSVKDFIHFHQEKYKLQQLLISVPQAITYFADAEEDQDPVSLQGQTWESVKIFIREKVREYLA